LKWKERNKERGGWEYARSKEEFIISPDEFNWDGS
jgi:hypothetical protein